MEFKINHIVLLLFILTETSCSDKEFIDNNKTRETVYVTAGVSSRAVFGDYSSGYYHSYWEDEDSITLYTKTQDNLVYTANVIEEDNTTTEFKAKNKCLKNNAGESVYASYPASTIENNIVVLPQTYNWTETRKIPFAYAIGNIEDGAVHLRFEHIFAYLEISLTNEAFKSVISTDDSKTIQKVIIESPSGSIGISSGTFNYEDQSVSITESTNEICVNLEKEFDPESEQERTFVIPILPLSDNAEINIYALHEYDNICDTLIAYKKTVENGMVKGKRYKKVLRSKPQQLAYIKGSYYEYIDYTYSDSLKMITKTDITYGTGNSYQSEVWEYDMLDREYFASYPYSPYSGFTLMLNEQGNVYERRDHIRYTDVYEQTFYSYDENEQLIKIIDKGTSSQPTDSTSYYWENGLLTYCYNDKDTISVKYSDIPVLDIPINVNHFLLSKSGQMGIPSNLAILNVLGKSSQHLVSSLTTSDNSKIEYSYEWNESNFLTKVTIYKDGNSLGHIDIVY